MSPDHGPIAVVYFAEGWQIVTGHHRWGRYKYRVDAEEAALRLADRARRQGRVLEVLVQEPHGELRRLVAKRVRRQHSDGGTCAGGAGWRLTCGGFHHDLRGLRQ